MKHNIAIACIDFKLLNVNVGPFVFIIVLMYRNIIKRTMSCKILFEHKHNSHFTSIMICAVWLWFLIQVINIGGFFRLFINVAHEFNQMALHTYPVETYYYQTGIFCLKIKIQYLSTLGQHELNARPTKREFVLLFIIRT